MRLLEILNAQSGSSIFAQVKSFLFLPLEESMNVVQTLKFSFRSLTFDFFFFKLSSFTL